MEKIICPKCKNLTTWKHGTVLLSHGLYQKYKCKRCAHIFRGKIPIALIFCNEDEYIRGEYECNE